MAECQRLQGVGARHFWSREIHGPDDYALQEAGEAVGRDAGIRNTIEFAVRRFGEQFSKVFSEPRIVR
jgi:hypothetical protein